MQFRPLHDRIVVRRVDAEEKTAGGIIIPDTAKEKPQQGEVVTVGPGARDETGKLIPIDLKAGDTVLFGKWSGTEVKIDGEDFVFAEDQVFVAIEFDVGARILTEQDAIAGFDIGGGPFPGLEQFTGAHGFYLALLRLLFGGVWNDNAALLRLAFVQALDQDAVM